MGPDPRSEEDRAAVILTAALFWQDRIGAYLIFLPDRSKTLLFVDLVAQGKVATLKPFQVLVKDVQNS